jgi:hypothetical protein
MDPCEYCHSPEQICTTRFTIDHILPRSLKGAISFACAEGDHVWVRLRRRDAIAFGLG